MTLYQDLPREGPGEASDVHWTLAQLDRKPERVADLGCGSGADLVTLAKVLPQAHLIGIDHKDQFVQTAMVRTAKFGDRVLVRSGNMAEPGGPFDLIWCAGAVYFMGIESALRAWAPCLSLGGTVAFSQPVQLRAPASATVRAFWGDEDHALLDTDRIAAQVAAAGYLTRATRLIIGAPWAAYYAPLEARIAALWPGASAELTEALDDCTREIALWRRAPDEIAYLLSVVEPA